MAADYHLPDICADMCQRTPEDIAKVNEKGFVPFFLAGMKGHTEMVAAIHEAALRHFGAKKGPDYTVRWVRHGNVSLLHHAALNDFAELTGWLIQHGADTEIFSSPSSSTPAYTPLMMACKFNCTRSACVLVNAGANVNVRVHDGLKGGGDLTPLHIAIQLGHMDLAAFLFSRGASNTCTFGCTKCRLHSTMLRRRLDTMRANIQARVATEEREAARRRELEEVLEDQEAMEGMSFDEFVAELRESDTSP
jgi:ankyrin repeat protein